MKAYLNTHILVALHVTIIAAVILGAAWYIDHSKSVTQGLLEDRIKETLTRVTELAEVTDRNGADELTERIITDCPRRDDFEKRLNNLGVAGPRDLIVTQQLFESCGNFFSERKAFMVAQLEREFALLEADIVLLGTLRDITQEEEGYALWKELIQLEKDRSGLLSEQTGIQEEIITLLIEGTGSTRINELVKYAQNVGQSLLVIDTQIDTLRAKLMQ